MKPFNNNTLGLAIVVQVPSTAEEFDQLAGRVGACLDEGTKNVIYRSVNHDFRKALCERLAEETGIARATVDSAPAEDGTVSQVQDPKETEKVYYNSLLADGHIDVEKAQVIANEIAADLTFDPSPTSRAKKAPKEIDNAVAGILAAVEAEATTAEIVEGKLAAKLGIEDFTASYGEFGAASLTAALLAEKAQADAARVNEYV